MFRLSLRGMPNARAQLLQMGEGHGVNLHAVEPSPQHQGPCNGQRFFNGKTKALYARGVLHRCIHASLRNVVTYPGATLARAQILCGRDKTSSVVRP